MRQVAGSCCTGGEKRCCREAADDAGHLSAGTASNGRRRFHDRTSREVSSHGVVRRRHENNEGEGLEYNALSAH